MMDVFLTVCGAIAVLMALAVVLMLLYYTAIDSIAERENRRFLKRLELENAHLGNKILSASWWFSEDEPTKKLVEMIGISIGKNGFGVDLEELRDKWRAERGC